MSTKTGPLFTPFQKLLIYLASFILGCVVVSYFARILMPFVVGLIVAYLLTPLVDRMESWLGGRLRAVALLYLAVTAVLVGVGSFVFRPMVNQFVALVRSLPGYLNSVQHLIVTSFGTLEAKFPILLEYHVLDQLQAQMGMVAKESIHALPGFLVSSMSLITYLLLVPLIVFLFLIEGPELKRKMLRLVPNKYFEMTIYMMYSIGSQIGRYLWGLIVEAAAVAGLSISAFFVVGLEYPIILGVLAGVANTIPYVGPVLAALPPILIFYLKMNTLDAVYLMVAVVIGLQIVDNLLIKPFVYSKSVDLPPLFVIFVLLVGGTIGGVGGLVCAVPIAGALRLAVIHVSEDIRFRLSLNSPEGRKIIGGVP